MAADRSPAPPGRARTSPPATHGRTGDEAPGSRRSRSRSRTNQAIAVERSSGRARRRERRMCSTVGGITRLVANASGEAAGRSRTRPASSAALLSQRRSRQVRGLRPRRLSRAVRSPTQPRAHNGPGDVRGRPAVAMSSGRRFSHADPKVRSTESLASPRHGRREAASERRSPAEVVRDRLAVPVVRPAAGSSTSSTSSRRRRAGGKRAERQRADAGLPATCDAVSVMTGPVVHWLAARSGSRSFSTVPTWKVFWPARSTQYRAVCGVCNVSVPVEFAQQPANEDDWLDAAARVPAGSHWVLHEVVVDRGSRRGDTVTPQIQPADEIVPLKKIAALPV